MKGDFSRETFDSTRHFRGVRMQQGRVQLDADWNEQADIADHIATATTTDTVGVCGAPENFSAFHVVTNTKDLTPQEQKLPQNKPDDPALKPGDFFLSAGRYYVGGILCENEKIVPYSAQPDLPGAKLIQGKSGTYVVYLDVWQRHLTALDQPQLREVALGGPDTATRAKAVWQVKVLATGVPTGDCTTPFKVFQEHLAPPTGMLSARERVEAATTDPCQVPPSAGYRGLENQLYRVEIHTGTTAYDVSAGAAETPVTGFTGTNKVRFAPAFSLAAGAAVEIFRTTEPMKAQFAFVTGVAAIDAQTTEATLNTDIAGLTLADNPRLRQVGAVFKWSRDNGSVVTAVSKIDGTEVSVHDLGPDNVLGFGSGQWVEVSTDTLELNGQSGPLVQVAKVTPGQTPTVTLKTPVALPGGVNPKLRRWDGAAGIKVNKAKPADGWMELESGVQVQFGDGTYRPHDYWLIPARAASADAETGHIDWPKVKQGTATVPAALLPAGIEHHYCRLAVVQFDGTNITAIDDCRPLFPPLTDLTTLVYVGGDGQEAMPGDPLPQPLEAGVFNDRRPVKGRKVRFTAPAGGKLALAPATLATGVTPLDVTTGPDGVASCYWLPAPADVSQQVEARLLSATGQLLPPVLHFDAQLSVAAQVSYDPAKCPDLKDAKTVQQAIDLLCKQGHGGCEAVVGRGGQFETIGEAIKGMVDSKRGDICLCVLQGDHKVVATDLAPLQAVGIARLKIAGCGLGTRVLFTGDAPIHLKELEALTLQTLTVVFDQPLMMQFGNDLVIDGCDVSGTIPATDTPLKIDRVGRVRLSNSTFAARGVGVSIDGPDGFVLVENNFFKSPLSFYGVVTDKRKTLTANDMAAASKIMKGGGVTVTAGKGVVQIRGNRLAQVMLGDEMLGSIAKVGTESKFSGLYQAAYIDNNLFADRGNELAAYHIALTANSFLPTGGEGDLGLAFARQAAFVANIGPTLPNNKAGLPVFRYAASDVVLQEEAQFILPGTTQQIRISAGNIGMRFTG